MESFITWCIQTETSHVHYLVKACTVYQCGNGPILYARTSLTKYHMQIVLTQIDCSQSNDSLIAPDNLGFPDNFFSYFYTKSCKAILICTYNADICFSQILCKNIMLWYSCFSQILCKNIMLWYSLEVPCLGTSNKYQQHNFSWRNTKNINIAIKYWDRKAFANGKDPDQMLQNMASD